jgi:hypothetical protein
MEHIRPLIIKYIYIAAITIIFLTFLLVPSVNLGTSMIIALFVTLVLYFAGDRYLLPRFGTLAAAIANFVIAAVVLSLANAFVREPLGTGVILATAAVIGVAEWFYFRYARAEVSPALEGGEIASFPEFLGENEPPPEQHGEGHEGGDNPEQNPEHNPEG